MRLELQVHNFQLELGLEWLELHVQCFQRGLELVQPEFQVHSFQLALGLEQVLEQVLAQVLVQELTLQFPLHTRH